MTGRSTGGKAINSSQLQAELEAASVDCGTGLGTANDLVFLYDAQGVATDFTAEQQPTVDQTISSHIALRDKTDAEYAEEFQDPATTAVRKQEIRDITAGLLPREQVPVT